MINIQQFFDKYNGQLNVGNTPENKGECVGLSSLWMDNFNVPHVYGHAKELYTNAPDEYFAKIANTPDAIVQEGDIAVWGAGYNGTYGHTGVARGKADVNKFNCFEQNDPLGSTPHMKQYNYAYVIGWLRPKKSAIITQPTPITDQTHIPVGGDFGEPELQAVRSLLNDQKKNIDALQSQVSDLTLGNVQQGALIQDLIKQLKDCQDKAPEAPQGPESPHIPPQSSLLSQLSDFFGRLFK